MNRKFQSALFCCDYNSVRSPMAEGICKNFFSDSIFVQSAGVKNVQKVDEFAIEVCKEINVELENHHVRSFEDMENWGDNISSFDIIIALSPSALRASLEYTRYYSLEIEFWKIIDPTGIKNSRNATLDIYRITRDQLKNKILKKFNI